MNDHENLESDIVDLIQKSQKIAAIKMLRERRHIGLKEAKDIVDIYMSQHPELRAAASENASPFTVAIIIFIVIAAGLYFSGIIG